MLVRVDFELVFYAIVLYYEVNLVFHQRIAVNILKLVGEETINEPWAFQHWITKNYMPFEEALNPQGGTG